MLPVNPGSGLLIYLEGHLPILKKTSLYKNKISQLKIHIKTHMEKLLIFLVGIH